MSFGQKDLKAVAKLARLPIRDNQVEGLCSDLANILNYVEKLNELDTSSVEPTAQLSVLKAPLREDQVLDGVDKKEALQQAPRANETGFLVPTFVDEAQS